MNPRLNLRTFAAAVGALLSTAVLSPGLAQTISDYAYDTYPQGTRSARASGQTAAPVVTRYAVENRGTPSGAAGSMAFAGAASQAAQVSAIRRAYGAESGPFTYSLGAGLEVEYNDNIFETDTNRESDFIFRPQANLTGIWGLSDLNTLSFSITGGYSYYLSNDQLNDYFVNTGFSPGSRIDLQIFVGDFVITIYDQFAYSNSPLQVIRDGRGGSGRLAATADYGRFLNTAGVDVVWDLNDLVLGAGYSRFNYWSLGDAVDTQDRSTDQITAMARLNFSPALSAGVEGSASWVSYSEDFQNDSVGYSAGPFVEWQPTDNTRLRLAGGVQNRSFDSGGGNQDDNDLSTWYGTLLIGQKLTDWFSHSIEVGREGALGTNTNYTVLQYIRHRASFDIIRNWNLSTELAYEKADDSGGAFAADTDTFLGAVSIGRMIANNLNLTLRYQYTDADSDSPLLSYKRNQVKLGLYYNY